MTEEFRELLCWKAPECHWRLNPWTVREIQVWMQSVFFSSSSFIQLTNKRMRKNKMLLCSRWYHPLSNIYPKKKTALNTAFQTLWNKQANILKDLFGFTSWCVTTLKCVTWFWDQTKVMTGIIALYLQGTLLTQEWIFVPNKRKDALCPTGISEPCNRKYKVNVNYYIFWYVSEDFWNSEVESQRWRRPHIKIRGHE